jgi:hypothetical protein
MFRMTDAPPDKAASALPPRPSGPMGPAATAARVRRRLKRWLGQLAGLASDAMRRMGDTIDLRRAQGGKTGSLMAPGDGRLDLNLVCELAGRAMRWTRALQARLVAEAAAAKAEMKLENRWREPPERLNDWDERDDDVSWIDSTLRRLSHPRPAGAPTRDDCIDGLPTAEVIGQICNDLGIVAVLFRSAETGERIAAIAAGAHALLGGQDRPWTPPPIPPAEHPAASEQLATWQVIARHMLAVVFAPAPVALADTG